MIGNLRLRPYKKEDGRYQAKWLTKERQMRLWCREFFAHPLTEEQMDAYYEKLENEENSWGFTALDELGIPVGCFRMSRVDYKEKSVHLGFIVIDPDRQGQGLGKRMVSMAVQYATEFLGMRRITLNVFDKNPGAKRCYEKAGFSVESYKEEDFQFKDEKWGCYLMVYHVE